MKTLIAVAFAFSVCACGPVPTSSQVLPPQDHPSQDWLNECIASADQQSKLKLESDCIARWYSPECDAFCFELREVKAILDARRGK